MANLLKPNLLMVIAITIGVIFSACAPAAAPAVTPPTTPAPSTTPTPSTTPPATATPSTAAAAEPSFTYDTYSNKDYGFTIKYPKKWKKIDTSAPYAVLRVQPTEELPNMTISIMDVATIQDQVKEIYAFWKLSNVKTLEQKEFTLADGKTKVMYEVSSMQHPAVPLKSYSASIVKGDKIINFGITALDGGEDPALYNDIFNTITFP